MLTMQPDVNACILGGNDQRFVYAVLHCLLLPQRSQAMLANKSALNSWYTPGMLHEED